MCVKVYDIQMKVGVLYLAFLLFMALVVVGAWHGKFSPRTRAIPVTETPEYKQLERDLVQAKADATASSDASFRYENAVGELTGVTEDWATKIRELMETIGKLSEENNELRDENDKLRTLLRDLSADFEELRKRLKICEARDASRRIEKQYCGMTPSSNLLL